MVDWAAEVVVSRNEDEADIVGGGGERRRLVETFEMRRR